MPPVPLHSPLAARGPLVHLCFITSLGVTNTGGDNNSYIRKVPFGIVTSPTSLGSSCLSDGPVDFTLPFTDSVNCCATVVIVDP